MVPNDQEFAANCSARVFLKTQSTTHNAQSLASRRFAKKLSKSNVSNNKTTNMASLQPICTHFLKGACKHGDKCTKSHVAPQGSVIKRHGAAGGKTTIRSSTMTETVILSDGSVTARETIVREVVWSPYSAHAGLTSGPKEAARDSFGNCKGPKFDLSPDDAFEGETIAILQLYGDKGLTFASPSVAMSRKGFKIRHWTALPPLEEFKAGLRIACQLWVISGSTVSVTAPYIDAIKELVHAKKGLFLWGDNDPFYADVNAILKALPETSELSLAGNYVGDQVLQEQKEVTSDTSGRYTDGGVGFRKHLVCTGLESMYEGITISNVQGPASQRRALIKSSDNCIVTACYDRNQCRIIIDGGFTRLMEDRWARTAGTERFVTNAACWLYNFEGRGHRRPGVGGGTAAKCKAPQLLPAARAPAASFDLDEDDLICRHFLNGTCKHGDKCRKSHERPATPLNFGGGGGGGGGSPATKQLAPASGLATGLKPIDPKSVLARNVSALLAAAPQRCIPGTQFKQAYAARFGVELDLQAGKLKDLIERLEAGGSCVVEQRPQLKGPPLLFVHAARHAASC
jgi:hypothetical protein